MDSFVAASRQCTFCPRLCRHACPVETASGREALTPKMKMQTALELRENLLPVDKDAAATLWGCSACGACEDECLHHNPVGRALYDARAVAVNRGLQPAALLGVIDEVARFEKSDAMVALDRAAFHEIQQNGFIAADVVVLLERSHSRPAFLAARRVRPDAKVAMAWDAREPQPVLSGRELREAGEAAAYQAHISRVAHTLRGCKEWWVLELSSLDDFEAAAKLCDPVPRVRSLVEVCAESGLGPQRRFRSVAVQLSCAIRRRPHVEEAVRVLAHRLSDEVRIAPNDMPFSGCCGGRGLIDRVMPEVAAEMAAGQAAELAELKAEATVTFSSLCHASLPGSIEGLPLFAPADW